MTDDVITLAMGSGGRCSAELIDTIFLPVLGNPALNALDDAAELRIEGARLAFTTDAFTVQPLFFPGGDIGSLSICGTCNDLAAKGAVPAAVAAAFIIEEGFPVEELKRIVRSMRESADMAGVHVVAGDTKVVRKGEADGLFIATSGIGSVMPGMRVSASLAREGDDILITGTIADHGIALLNTRERLGFTPEPRSDVGHVGEVVTRIAPLGARIHAMRDPTRGGVAGVLNEIARASGVTMILREDALPLRPEVRACCELLGMDPLYMPNEGKLLVIAEHGATSEILERIRGTRAGRDAAIIGSVGPRRRSGPAPLISLQTAIGARRFLPPPEGEQLPRIC
ncbi:MAG: hydrogenase expression/formation protein HypE [Candidatus Aureabacteria bacterium]|nr:hydrogenase expression/formation protein HypE [Candidatus Auribacterota bacterium]